MASLLPADLLVILTTVDGLVENFGTSTARLLKTVDQIDETIEKMAGGTDNPTAVGGMTSKLQAARIVVRAGIPLIIASGKIEHNLSRVLDGQEEGTLFVAQPNRLKGRKRWIAFFHHPKGSIFVDDGARKALRELGKSLLPPGVVRCDGHFGPVTSFESAIATALSLPAAFRASVPPRSPPIIIRERKSFIAMTW